MRARKHGCTPLALYRAWENMKKRCLNKNNEKYHRYGGRGITICKEWMDFAVFREHMLSIGWNSSLQIDRKDNDQGYNPNNVRVATCKENNQNTANSRRWHVRGSVYNSSSDAATGEKVSRRTINNWCYGFIARGKWYPPRADCWSESLYID